MTENRKRETKQRLFISLISKPFPRNFKIPDNSVQFYEAVSAPLITGFLSLMTIRKLICRIYSILLSGMNDYI
jgi:hypothetical protein